MNNTDSKDYFRSYLTAASQGETKKALRYLQKEMKTTPNYDLCIVYANELKKLGRHRKACKVCDAAISIEGNRFEAFSYRAGSQFILRNYDATVEDYTQAIRFVPVEERIERADLHYLRAMAYMILLKYELALEDIDKVIELNPNDAQARFSKERLLELRKSG